MRILILTTLAVGAMSTASAQAPTQASGKEPPSEASSAPSSDPDQAIRCRKVKVTGSLVKQGKVCKTLAEWRKITESGNELARRLVEDGTSRPGGQ